MALIIDIEGADQSPVDRVGRVHNKPSRVECGVRTRRFMMKRILFGAALATLMGTAALAETPTPRAFVDKAGASDTFEMDSAKLMANSKNRSISAFATRMITDHSKSTKMVEAAARADHVTLHKPEMTVGQRTDLTALKALPNGKTRDALYVKQQKAAHDDALALMQDYAANGTARHLKATAAGIAPVVERHQAMLSTL